MLGVSRREGVSEHQCAQCQQREQLGLALALLWWRAGYAEGQEFFSQMLSVLDFVSVLFVVRCFPRMLQQKYRCFALGSSSSLLEVDGYFLVVAGIATGRLFGQAAALGLLNLGWWLSPDFPPASNSAFPSLCRQSRIVAADGMDLCTHGAYICLSFFWLCVCLDGKVPSQQVGCRKAWGPPLICAGLVLSTVTQLLSKSLHR